MNKEVDYAAFYASRTAWFRKKPGRVRALRMTDRILTALMYAVYPVMLIVLMYAGYQGGARASVLAGTENAMKLQGGLRGAFYMVFPYILIPGGSFIAVSMIRDRINWKRPYEEWDIDPLIHKETRGHSMPSRHVFSSAVIAMSVLSLQVFPGVVLLGVTILSAIVRVLGGVHYPQDTAAGFCAGVAAGALLWLL